MSAWVVISPATTARSVVTRVSQATRLVGSAWRQWSRTASLIWSATLSGWPMETDSLVNRYRSALTGRVLTGERRLRVRTLQRRNYRARVGRVATTSDAAAAAARAAQHRARGWRPMT